MREPSVLATVRAGSVWPLVLTSLAIMGSPGPVTISLTATGSARGVRRSLAYWLGTVAGTLTVLLAVATGVTAAVLAIPHARTVLIAASAVYLLWLAYKIATAPPPGDVSQSTASPTFASGVVLGVANPKGWVAIAAVYASGHLSGTPAADAVAKFAVLTVMVFVISGGWLLIGSSMAPLFRDAHRARVLNIALAVALVAATLIAVVG
jgi:threonine/homoserine/homoserine lactone efflux protein